MLVDLDTFCPLNQACPGKKVSISSCTTALRAALKMFSNSKGTDKFPYKKAEYLAKAESCETKDGQKKGHGESFHDGCNICHCNCKDGHCVKGCTYMRCHGQDNSRSGADKSKPQNPNPKFLKTAKGKMSNWWEIFTGSK